MTRLFFRSFLCDVKKSMPAVRFMSYLFMTAVAVLCVSSTAFAAEGEGNMLLQWANSMMETKWGQYGLIAIFFTLIIVYLRVLFGPKGFFREKQWDEWNEEARKKEALRQEAERKEREEAVGKTAA